jgi:hypothetical protein
MVGRVPVAAGEDRQAHRIEAPAAGSQRLEDRIAARHREAAAGQKVALNVNHQQCIAGARRGDA